MDDLPFVEEKNDIQLPADLEFQAVRRAVEDKKYKRILREFSVCVCVLTSFFSSSSSFSFLFLILREVNVLDGEKKKEAWRNLGVERFLAWEGRRVERGSEVFRGGMKAKGGEVGLSWCVCGLRFETRTVRELNGILHP